MDQVHEGQEVILIGVVLGAIVGTEAGKVIKLGASDPLDTTANVVMVKLECGDVVKVHRRHVHARNTVA